MISGQLSRKLRYQEISQNLRFSVDFLVLHFSKCSFVIDHWLLLRSVKRSITCLFRFCVKASSSPLMFSWCAYAWDEERSWYRKNYLKADDKKERFFCVNSCKSCRVKFWERKRANLTLRCHMPHITCAAQGHIHSPMMVSFYVHFHPHWYWCTAQFWNWEALMMWLAFYHHIIIFVAMDIGINQFNTSLLI